MLWANKIIAKHLRTTEVSLLMFCCILSSLSLLSSWPKLHICGHYRYYLMAENPPSSYSHEICCPGLCVYSWFLLSESRNQKEFWYHFVQRRKRKEFLSNNLSKLFLYEFFCSIIKVAMPKTVSVSTSNILMIFHQCPPTGNLPMPPLSNIITSTAIILSVYSLRMVLHAMKFRPETKIRWVLCYWPEAQTNHLQHDALPLLSGVCEKTQ